MSRLKLAGPALLYVVFLFPTFAQDPTANMFAKQVEHDVAALSSQPSVGAWQKLHPGEKLQLMHYDLGKADYADDLGLEFDNWCAGSISQSPSTFGRVAVFFVPSVKVGALPPLPGSGYASIKESCRMQALHYRVSPDTSAQDLVRELSSVWGTSDRGHAISGSQFDLPEGVCDIIANWDHDGLSARLKYSCSGGPVSTYRTGIMLYVRRDAIPAAPCDDCEGSLIFPLYSEKLPQYLQEAAQIAAEDPALTQQIISWSGHWNNPRWDPKWAVEPAVARNNLRKWLEVAKQRSPHQRAAALLLADLYVEGADLVYAAKPDAPPTCGVLQGAGRGV